MKQQMQPPQTIAWRKQEREMQFRCEWDTRYETPLSLARVKNAIAELISAAAVARRSSQIVSPRSGAVAAINKSGHVSPPAPCVAFCQSSDHENPCSHSRQLFV